MTLQSERHDDTTDDAVARFSQVALGSVVVVVLTGTLNAVIRLDSVSDLWESRYGVTLLVKLGAVTCALAAAVVSRRFVRESRSPWRSVRVEAVATLVVLAVTTVLATTAPPGVTGAPSTGPDRAVTRQQPSVRTVRMDLGEGRSGLLHITGLHPGGSSLHVQLKQADGSPMTAVRVQLKMELRPERLWPFDIPLHRDQSGWLGTFSFALPGTWTATLSVEDEDLDGIVTTGRVTIVE